MNYFELFELPVAPRVDKSFLARKYFELQKRYHPDFFSNASEEDREEALQKSAAINKAFNIFQDEQKTIEYFLQEKKLINEEEKYNLPPDFLMEMMDINESLDEDEPAVTRTKVENYEKELFSEIEPVLSAYNENNTTAMQERLKAYYYKKKYLRRILDRLPD